MSQTRTYTLAIIGLVLAVLLAGWFALVNPKRSEATGLREQTVSQEQTNASYRSQIEQLQAQAADLPEQQARLAEIRSQIPVTPALPALIRSLTATAGSAGLELRSLKPGTAETVVEEAPAAAAATTEEGSEASATPAETPVTTDTGQVLTAIPIEIEVQGTYFEIEKFINSAEELTRALLVTRINMQPVDSDDSLGELTGTVTARVFMTQANAGGDPAATS